MSAKTTTNKATTNKATATAKAATLAQIDRKTLATAKVVCKAVEHATELHALLDAASELVNAAIRRGYVPTLSIRAGTIGMVATFPITSGTVGRPPKCATADAEGVE